METFCSQFCYLQVNLLTADLCAQAGTVLITIVKSYISRSRHRGEVVSVDDYDLAGKGSSTGQASGLTANPAFYPSLLGWLVPGYLAWAGTYTCV